ncbi:MAG: MFS transporter [Pseudomonadota bacterium]
MSTPFGTRFAISISLFFAAFFLVIGVMLPFLPLWLAGRGLSETEIAMVVALPMLIRVVATPGLSLLIDRSLAPKRVLIGLALIGTTAFAALEASQSYIMILLVSLIGACVWHPLMASLEAIAQSGAQRFRQDYGRLRLSGSASFILANLAGGAVIAWLGTGSVIWMMTLAALMTAVSLLLLPDIRVQDQDRTPPSAVMLWHWLCRPAILFFVIGIGLIQASHAVYYAFGTVHWESLGHSSTLIGGLWAIGVVAEIVLFAVSGRVLGAIGIVGLLLAAGLGSAVRWTVTAFDPGLAMLAIIQLGHALTFGATHLAGVTLISRIAPEGAGSSAQAIQFTMSGVIMGCAVLSAGPAYAAFGGHAYLIMAVLGVLGAALALVGARRLTGYPHKAGSGGDTVAPS